MQLINSLSLPRLRNSEYFNLISSLKALLLGVLPSTPVTDELQAAFATSFEKLDVVNSVDSGTVLTDQIQIADQGRGNTWKGMDLIVNAYLHSPVAAQVESAKIIRRVFDVYGDYRKQSYDSETGNSGNLVRDLEKPENAVHCNKIKLSPWLPLYKSELEAFIDLQNLRDVERAYKSSGDVKVVRNEMNPLYNQIMNIVNSYVSIGMASPEMENFVVVMNQKIKRYNDTLSAREGRRNVEGDSSDPDIEID